MHLKNIHPFIALGDLFNKRVVMINIRQFLKVQQGKLDLIILILLFIGIQAWWVIPIIIRNNKMNEKGKDIREEIKQLERIFRRN